MIQQFARLVVLFHYWFILLQILLVLRTKQDGKCDDKTFKVGFFCFTKFWDQLVCMTDFAGQHDSVVAPVNFTFLSIHRCPCTGQCRDFVTVEFNEIQLTFYQRLPSSLRTPLDLPCSWRRTYKCPRLQESGPWRRGKRCRHHVWWCTCRRGAAVVRSCTMWSRGLGYQTRARGISHRTWEAEMEYEFVILRTSFWEFFVLVKK